MLVNVIIISIYAVMLMSVLVFPTTYVIYINSVRRTGKKKTLYRRSLLDSEESRGPDLSGF